MISDDLVAHLGTIPIRKASAQAVLCFWVSRFALHRVVAWLLSARSNCRMGNISGSIVTLWSFSLSFYV